MNGYTLAKHYLRLHGGEMERAIAEREAAVSILIDQIDRKMSDAAASTILNAVYYLRSGRFPIARTHQRKGASNVQ